jgi:LuxR family quorum-sensing system transcriptional regulator CciR
MQLFGADPAAGRAKEARKDTLNQAFPLLFHDAEFTGRGNKGKETRRQMSRLADVQTFIDVSRQLTNPADLDALIYAVSREMGFDYYALIHHVDLAPFEYELGHMSTGQLIALSNYPENWIEEYIRTNIIKHDPVVLASQRTNVGFAWSDIPQMISMTDSLTEQLDRARTAGIGDGYTVPSNVPGEANGSCHFVVRTGRELPDRDTRMMAQLVGSYAFQAARSIVTHAKQLSRAPVRLSPRQIECIALVGRGQTDKGIARRLGLSEHTVKEYLEDARLRYGVSKRVQLVLRALYDGNLPLSDMLRG